MSELQQPGGISIEQSTHSALYCIALSEANSFDHNGCLHTPAGTGGEGVE